MKLKRAIASLFRSLKGGQSETVATTGAVKNIQPVEGGREEIDEALSRQTRNTRKSAKLRKRRYRAQAS
ncbi:MAG: hypothetical protein A2X94_06520 [Bdellovibrionales bacterium GWB1_55_8]|nr:MAG: hypothetical protein A2X94_06520 [Bdellovibrionales bacterium GWB1_55_8]